MPRVQETILSLEEYIRLSQDERAPYIASLFEDMCDENGNSDSEAENALEWEYLAVSDNEELPDVVINNEVQMPTSSSSDDDDEAAESPFESQAFSGKDGTVWYSQPTDSSQTLRHNTVQRCGPARRTELMNVSQTFKCFMTIEMVDIIVHHTNKKAESYYNYINARNPGAAPKIWKQLTVAECYAFFGILITAGANRSCNENVRDLWSPKNYPLYRATMGVNRFSALLRFIRFDNANTRTERQQTDKTAPISELWSMMNAKLFANYKPSESLTIDEQLFPYRDRTSFTQYIPSKPAKYGIKVWWICDAQNSYPLHGQIYTGMQVTGRETNQGERVVQDLAVKFRGTGRNITMNNFFTTLKIAEHLLSWDLTLIGTLRKNEPYIPPTLKPHKDRPIGSTKFAFRESVTMCSYVPKKNKALILLSTMHNDDAINASGTPEMIQYYNKNKGGVDIMDLLFSEYSTQRQTRRWPLSLFFNMIDISCLAANIIYHLNNPMLPKHSSQRKEFLRKLGEELCIPVMESRALNRQAMRHKNTRSAIECYILLRLPLEDLQPSTSSQSRSRPIVGSCYMCHLTKENRNRKTRKICCMCGEPMCLQHSVTNCMCTLCSSDS